MKKRIAAILICDLMIGLLLFCGYVYKQKRENIWQAANEKIGVWKHEEIGQGEWDEVKKIALTFDDDVIIGLS